MGLIVALGLVVVTLVVIVWGGRTLAHSARRVDALAQVVAQLVTAQHEIAHRVDQLAGVVGQSRQQLHRALELSSAVHRLIYGALYREAALAPDDISTINTYLIELKAIAVVNGDTDFIERVGKLRVAVEHMVMREPDGHTPTLTVSKATEDVQRKVYDLLAAARHN